MATHTRWKVAQTAERKWWQNYLKNKDVDTYLTWKKKYWTDLLRTCNVTVNSDAHLLDAGCGPAGIFIIFDNNKITACDPLLNTYEQDLPHFKKSNYKQVNFVNTSIENFQVPATGFDFIFCMNAINHVQDIHKSYDILCNSLKSGGTMVISIDAHNNNVLKSVFKALPGDILHPHQYNLNEYEKFLTDRNIEMKDTILMKEEFFFNHYVQVGVKK